ncbi:tyrosine-type recombinase/integrase [Psychrobacter alimentarius]|uniref:tyrosine-type recombinase/integrase n=1 Tax=Psychrobacter alimentarius TaxID=261164 RepID=UPI0019182BE9|nr:tyrosine-type recombinase/integrase [Psychrobacter alimentarius]
MTKSFLLASHELREANQEQHKLSIKNKAATIVTAYLSKHQPFDDSQMEQHYQAIDTELSKVFFTSNNYRLARQGFLQAVRNYNKENKCSLYEPIVPIVAQRDNLTIGYNWFVEGSKVSKTWEDMQLFWQRKRKFSANDYVSYLLYSSIMFGGLNDIDALRALYRWLFSKRHLHLINLSKHSISDKNLDPECLVFLIPLSIRDEKYGCHDSELDSKLTRYMSYLPDDISISFLYALGDTDINEHKIQQFETIIKELNNKFELTCRDANKAQLSHLIKYANFHWRQLPYSQIDGATSLVMQGQIKTTSLPNEQLLTYNQENIQPLRSAITWQQLFLQSSSTNDPSQPKEYSAFSKNIMQCIQDALKGSKPSAVNDITALLSEFTQPNAIRLLGWVLSLLASNQTLPSSISLYVGNFGREWLMLTMDEDLDEWGSEDFEDIYGQIIQSKVKDGRKNDVLQKDPINDQDDIELDEEDIECLNLDEEPNSPLSSSEAINYQPKFSDQKTSIINDLKITQAFTHGRIKAFHNYQVQDFNAPKVHFAGGGNRQVVKASMISPRLYNAMQSCLNKSDLNKTQKQLCQSVLAIAYRTGMRVNELAGIQVGDIENYIHPDVALTPNHYRRLKSSSARRRLLISSLLKSNELETFTLFCAHQKRVGAKYLFSQGTGTQPLPTYFFGNLMRILWNGLLGQVSHDYTFHSFRHTAISQLTLVINKSPLAQIMTDYTVDECDTIINSLAGHHQEQGLWFSLASFVGHLTCDMTFEHYIHTAHLLAGWQLNQARLEIPFTVFHNITGISYQKVNYHDNAAYNKVTKTVVLKKLRLHFAKHLKAHHSLLFTSPKDNNHELFKKGIVKSTDISAHSIFIDSRYDMVISFLRGLDTLKTDLRLQEIEKIAMEHGLDLAVAHKIYENAINLNNNDKLIITTKGQNTQKLIDLALDNAHKMSIDNPDLLREFINIYKAKHITSRSYLKFGIKKSQHILLSKFMKIGCQLVEPRHWQIISDSEQAVTDFKKKYKLDSNIRIGARVDCREFEVRIIKKIKNRSDSKMCYESSGVLKFLGSVLAVLVNDEAYDVSSNNTKN